MPVHLALLGRLHLVLGAFGVLCGLSLLILAAGTSVALVDLTMGTEDGRAGRFGALALAVPNLAVVPFGTALSVYAFWVLLNDDARAEFGRPLRTTGPSRPDPR